MGAYGLPSAGAVSPEYLSVALRAAENNSQALARAYTDSGLPAGEAARRIGGVSAAQVEGWWAEYLQRG